MAQMRLENTRIYVNILSNRGDYRELELDSLSAFSFPPSAFSFFSSAPFTQRAAF